MLTMGVGMTFMFRSTEYKTQNFDGLTTAKEFKKFIKINKFNLISNRKPTINYNTGCVGPTLATLLGWHQLYYYMLLNKSNKTYYHELWLNKVILNN